MFTNGQHRWWTNELARLHDGRFVIPTAWILRRGRMTADVQLVTRNAQQRVWECRGKEEEIDVTQFEADFDDLIMEFGPDFIWTPDSQEFVPPMPNAGRKLSGNRDPYVLGVTVWIDDVSGNKSKQYNKFLVMLMQNTSLPGLLLKQEFHIHFCGASQHVTTAELNAVLRDFVQGTEREPIICYNAQTSREAAVIVRVHDKNADNPQQSEEASHIGCNGTFPCRKSAQHWLEEQPGDKINPLLDIVGLDPARDTPVEILHTILLGVIKYIWHHLNTYKWTDNERHLLAIRLRSTDISGMNVPPIRGAYMMQYRNNLIGKHYKTIMQSLVFHVHGICNPDQFKLIKFAADLGARVWISVIDDMEEYISELNIAIANLLDAWDAVEPLRILTKIKLHLLPHLPDDIRRFGPAVRFSTETQESYNAAPSRDIAMKFAAMNNIKHAVCGGFWQSSAAYDSDQQLAIEAVRGWSEPGNTVKKLLFDDPVLQRHLGWVPHHPPVPGFQTITSRHWTQEHPSQPILNSAWRQGLSVTSKTGDKVKVDGWAFVRIAGGTTALGRVVEIISGGSGQTWICLQQFVCTQTRHPDFDWPVVRPPAGNEITEQGLTSYVVIPGTAVEFGCSVQHDCRRGNCKPAAMAKERQEREDTLRDISLIKHVDDDNFVLNLGSVHNFAELTRVLPRSLYNLKPQHSDRL
ncbi:hypothetical protein MIND_00581900 [Mycena indigotica]|uniref:Uncharacterized protein n=1 Tax=Mycena indigotica TaxID=2126181 RepID=A0A8H6W3E5_9AGAR|nr:uncharacterized protein MIND_00581900 [Mycena indigotica]KAF7303527.1 hypothetical protein MIND_00581900 [Mycena indigotica]